MRASGEEMASFARQALEAGATTEGLAQELGVSEDQVKQWAGAAGEATGTTKKFDKAQGALLKKALLWTFGAASVYRAYMKLRRALEEGYREVYGNTEAFQDYTKALDRFKHSMILAIIPPRQMADVLKVLEDQVRGNADALDTHAEKSDAAYILLNRMRDAAEGNRDAQLALVSTAYNVVGGTDELLKRLEEINEKYDLGVDVSNAYAEAQDGVADALDRAGQAADNLTQRIDKALKSYRKDYAEDMTSRYIQRLEDIEQAEINSLESRIDAWRSYYQRAADLAQQHRDQLADLNTEISRKAADIEQDYQDKLADMRGDTLAKREELAEDLSKKLLRIELNFQEKRRRIQENYQMEMWEAVAERDATAALKAERRRKLELRRAERERGKQTKLAQVDYQDRLDDLGDYQREKRQEIERDRRREIRDLETYERRKREDLNTAYRRQIRDLETANDRKLEEIDATYDAEITRAQAHYRQQESLYYQHLQNQLRLQQWYAGQSGGMDYDNPYSGPYDHLFKQKGGSFVVNSPRTLTVGEGNRPELVNITPLSGTMQHQYTGDLNHQFNARIEQTVSGLSGRIDAAVTKALGGLFR
jgi:hypothetical protein